ncbi:MAG: endonuclease domain-containing protein [Bacteroidales bacterium]|nr:endonuclease domain-containing protein [Bacteroidales bacterium]
MHTDSSDTPQRQVFSLSEITGSKTKTSSGESSPSEKEPGKKVKSNPVVTSRSQNRNFKPGYVTANEWSYPFIKDKRDALMNNPTESEKIMWELLRNKKTGHKIRRQHIIDNFITDFVCILKRVVIEIDGKIHLKQHEYDELRTRHLNDLGFEVIRFTNEEVLSNPALVAEKIKQYLDKTPDHIFDNATQIHPESENEIPF